jgi:hypothetical protein
MVAGICVSISILVIAVSLGFFIYLGGFSSPSVVLTTTVPIKVLYKEGLEDYSSTNSYISTLYKVDLPAEIHNVKRMGFYFDNPPWVSEGHKPRFAYGFSIPMNETKNKEIQSFMQKLKEEHNFTKSIELPPVTIVECNVPYKNIVSNLIKLWKCYGKVYEIVDANYTDYYKRDQMPPATEIYDDKITIQIPVGDGAHDFAFSGYQMPPYSEEGKQLWRKMRNLSLGLKNA